MQEVIERVRNAWNDIGDAADVNMTLVLVLSLVWVAIN